MGNFILIYHEHDEVLNTDYFVDQLKKKWSEVKVHFITDPNAHSLLQFSEDNFGLLGDFHGGFVAYQAYVDREIAQFALWYRSIVPAGWELQIGDSALSFDFMFITNETTEEQLIAGFAVPFDMSKYE